MINVRRRTTPCDAGTEPVRSAGLPVSDWSDVSSLLVISSDAIPTSETESSRLTSLTYLKEELVTG